jgi:signal transduction histidine kinase
MYSRQAAWRQTASARQELDLARLREEEQRRVLDGVPGAVYQIVWSGRDALPIALFRNQVFATWFGIPQERSGNRGGDITNRLDPPVSREHFAALYDDLYHTGSAVVEARARIGDGNLRWVRFHARLERRRGNELDAIVLATDIEQEKAAAAAIAAAAAQREGEMRRILDGLPAAGYGITLTADGRVLTLYGNPTIGRLLRAPPDFELRLTNGAWARQEPPPGPGDLAAVYAALARDGEMVRECPVRLYDGALHWLRFHARRIAHDGDTLEAIVLLSDIETEKAATSGAIAAARLATLGQLSVGLAHEIAQPLTAIALYAEHSQLLLETAPERATPRLIEYQELILGMVLRTREITDHLRRFGRRQDSVMEPVSLAAVMRGALLLSNGPLVNAGITVEQDLPADLPPVRGRQVLLEQVLTNLLLNARDAIEAAAPERRCIRVTAREDGGHVRLAVADSGPGIPPGVMHRLFDPFFTTKPSGKGTGLGLSICQGILAACGGTISTANAPDGGAVFTLALPRWQAEGNAAAEAGAQAA